MIGSLLLIIDAGDLTARCYHGAWPSGGPEPSKDDYRSTFRVIQSITASMEQWRPSSIVLVCDADNAAYERKKFWPKYKAHRSSDDIFKHHRKFAIMLLAKTLPIHILKRDRFEADDLMAQLCARSWSKRVVVLTNDHDLLQVHQAFPDRVIIYSANKQCELRLPDPGIDFRKYKALTGDKSDGIPSVTGPVTAAKLLHPGGKLDEYLDTGTTKSENLPRRQVYERNLHLVSLVGPECLVPRIHLPDVESEVRQHNLSYLRQLCMTRLCPSMFNNAEMDRIESAWRSWFVQRTNEGHGIINEERKDREPGEEARKDRAQPQ